MKKKWNQMSDARYNPVIPGRL